MAYVAYAVAWLCMTFLVYIGIQATDNWKLLIWFMLIPALMSVSTSKSTSDDKTEEKDDGCGRDKDMP